MNKSHADAVIHLFCKCAHTVKTGNFVILHMENIAKIENVL